MKSGFEIASTLATGVMENLAKGEADTTDALVGIATLMGGILVELATMNDTLQGMREERR